MADNNEKAERTESPDLSGLRTVGDSASEARGLSQRALKPGELFAGRYAVDILIGEGGAGSVYRVFDRTTEDIIALKLLRPDRVLTPETRKQLIREAVLARNVRHPNVVAVYDVGEASGQTYVAMELLSGQSLRGWMRGHLSAGTECSFTVAAGIVFAVLDALEAAHAQGLVHRDLKPENIFLSAEPAEGAIRLKLLDFGLARTAGEAPSSGAMAGTPHYMAPEQITAPDTVRPSADIYSVAVIFYELLVGVLPQGHWQPPSRGRGDVPAAVDGLIEGALSNRPRSRPQTVQDFRSALQAACDTPEMRKARADAELRTKGPAAMREHAKSLYRGGDGDVAAFPEAQRWFLSAAEAGDPEAMSGLGQMLWEGASIARDEAGSRKWFEKAAEAGDLEGIHVYAGMLSAGSAGLAKDEARARGLWTKAAEAGHANSMYYLAGLLAEGRGGPKDIQTALAWYRRAFKGEQHIADRIKQLEQLEKREAATKAAAEALQLFNGRDIKTDPVRARELNRLAAENGDAVGMSNYACMLELGAGGQKDLSAAREWFRKAAETGAGVAMTNYANYLRDGTGGPKDEAGARAWYKKAVQAGDEDAAKALKRMDETPKAAPPPTGPSPAQIKQRADALYKEGKGSKSEIAEALKLYNQAAEAGDLGAMTALGRIWRWAEEAGLKRDADTARKWFAKAAEAGDVYAMYMLGWMLKNGEWNGPGFNPDYEGAARWLKKAAAAGEPRAAAMLGEMFSGETRVKYLRMAADGGWARAMTLLGRTYLFGSGDLKVDKKTARQWLEQAAAKGDDEAKGLLKEHF